MVAAFAVVPLSSGAKPGPLCLENTCLQLLEPRAASAFLSTDDAFLRALTPYDRAMRMKVNREVTREEFAKFIGQQALPWTAADKRRLESAVAVLKQQLAAKRLAFQFLPKKVRVIKSTGLEEGQAPYTRGDVIVIPAKLLGNQAENLTALLAHELIHVLIRSVYPERRDALYAMASFRPIRGFTLPAEAGERILTNPDGFGYSHAAELADGTRVVPVLRGTGPYDPQKGGEFFSYLDLQLLEVELHEGKWRAKRDDSGALKWRRPDAAYVAALQSVTSYIIHPDELVASNFEALLEGKPYQPGSLPDQLAQHFRRR